MKMRVRALAIVVYLLMSIALALPVSAAKEMKHRKLFEGGNIYRAGEGRVLGLIGNYRQMGRQYGELVKDNLQAMHTTIGEVFLNNPDKDKGGSHVKNQNYRCILSLLHVGCHTCI